MENVRKSDIGEGRIKKDDSVFFLLQVNCLQLYSTLFPFSWDSDSIKVRSEKKKPS